MRLVKFKDGNYGIRRHWFFGWHFQVVRPSGDMVLKKNHEYFSLLCKATRDEVLTKYRRMNSKDDDYQVITLQQLNEET